MISVNSVGVALRIFRTLVSEYNRDPISNGTSDSCGVLGKQRRPEPPGASNMFAKYRVPRAMPAGSEGVSALN